MEETFSKRLRDEIHLFLSRRHKFAMSKLAYCTGLLGVGSLSLTSSTGTIFQFIQLLYLVPLVAIAYDLQILAEDFRAKRAGIFLSNTASIEEQEYEKFVGLRPNILAPIAHTSSTFVLIFGAAFILWSSGTNRFLFFSWLSVISLIEGGLFIYTSRMRKILSIAGTEPPLSSQSLTPSTELHDLSHNLSVETTSKTSLNKKDYRSELTAPDAFEGLLPYVSFIASVAQLFLLILTVIYSNDQYNLWHVGIAIFVIYLWITHKYFWAKDTISATIAQIGVSISIMIITMFISVYFIALYLSSFGLLLQKVVSSPYKELILSGVEITISFIVYLVLFQVPEGVVRLNRSLKKRRS